MRRLKTATDPWIEPPARPYRPDRAETRRWIGVPQVIGGVELVLGAAWALVTLPFRLVFGLFGLLGRLAALITGFSIMVLGAALLPSPIPLLGLILFAIGLLLSLRSLG